MVPLNISMFITPVFAGFMRDATGTYDVSFLTIGGISLLGAILFLLLGAPPAHLTPSVTSSQPAD
jgi:hypothetical protein